MQAKAYLFHHAFTHFCPVCPPLPSYAKGQSGEQIKAYSESFDAFWKKYSLQCFKSPLEIVYHCHPMVFGGTVFQSTHDLLAACPALDNWNDFRTKGRHFSMANLRSLLEHRDICIFVVGQGRQTATVGQGEGAAVFTKRQGHTVLARRTFGPTLFFGPYLAHLLNSTSFELDTVHHLIIYKSSSHLQPIFEKLVTLRTRAGDSYQADQLKLCCNAFIGMAGSFKMTSDKVYITEGAVSMQSQISRYRFRYIAENVIQCTRTYEKALPRGQLYCLHVAVLQCYRFKLLLAMEAMRRVLRPESYRILQCKTDSFLIGFSELRLEHCVRDLEAYRRLWPLYFSPVKHPGKFSKVGEINFCNFELLLPGITQRIIWIERNPPGQEKASGRLAKEDRPRFIAKYTNDKMAIAGRYDQHLLYLVPFE